MRQTTLQQTTLVNVIGDCDKGIPVQLVCNFCEGCSLQTLRALLQGRTKLYASVTQMSTLCLHGVKMHINIKTKKCPPCTTSHSGSHCKSQQLGNKAEPEVRPGWETQYIPRLVPTLGIGINFETRGLGDVSTLGGTVSKSCSTFNFGFRVTTPCRGDDYPPFSNGKYPTYHYFHICSAPPICARKVPEGQAWRYHSINAVKICLCGHSS